MLLATSAQAQPRTVDGACSKASPTTWARRSDCHATKQRNLIDEK